MRDIIILVRWYSVDGSVHTASYKTIRYANSDLGLYTMQ